MYVNGMAVHECKWNIVFACECVHVCVLCVVHAYKNTVACVGGVCWLKLHARTCLVGM